MLHYTSSHLCAPLEICLPNSRTALLPGCRRAGRATKPFLHLLWCCSIAGCPGENILERRSHTFPEAMSELHSLTTKNREVIHIITLKKKKKVQLVIYFLKTRTQLHFEVMKSSMKQNIHPNVTVNANVAPTEVSREFCHWFL